MTDPGLALTADAGKPAPTGGAPDLFSKFDPVIELRRGLLEGGVTDPFNLVMERVESPTVAICNGRRTILLGTYNYMGMTFDPDVIAAGQQALEEFGSGTTGSRVLNGTYRGHRECEDALREFYAMDHAMVFSTGYQANLGIISTMAGKDDYIILDTDSHASIYDGCALGNAQIVAFRHNDVDALEKRLKRLPADAGKLVVLEGVYSMLGDTAPLKEIAEVKREAGAYLLVDEAHSLGVLGERGRGLAEAAGVEADVDFIVGTFSKSLGSMGGFLVSDDPAFDILRVACRPYMFTASLPPAVTASTLQALQRLEAEPLLRVRLRSNARKLHDGLAAMGFDVGAEPTPVIAVRMPDSETAVRFWRALLDAGVYLNLALPPATPQGLCLLRASISAAHTTSQIETALDAFSRLGQALEIPGVALKRTA